MNTQNNILNAEIVANRIGETSVRPDAAQKRIDKLAYHGVTIEMSDPTALITVKSERKNRTDSFTLDQLMLKALVSATAVFNDLDSDTVFSFEKVEAKGKGKQPAVKAKQAAIALSPTDKLARLHYSAADAWLAATLQAAHEQHTALLAMLDGYTRDELAARETPIHDSLATYYDSAMADSIRDELRFASKKEHIAAFIGQAGLTIDASKGADAIQVIRTDKGVSVVVELVGKYAPDAITEALASYKAAHADAWDSCKLSYDKELVKLMGKAPIVLIFSL